MSGRRTLVQIGRMLLVVVTAHAVFTWQPVTAEETPEVVGKTVTTNTGLQYVDLVVGNGRQAAVGDTATVHYTGWLENGTKFDSSLTRGEPFTFQIGSGMVIKGWDEGVRSMRRGGTRKLIIPPHLGYGKRGVGDIIPPNATLTFEVQLLELR